MTSKFELSLTSNYVKDWGVVQAVREIFQNALDQQNIDSGNAMFFGYDMDNHKLTIGSKYSVLERKTLLLGYTTKSNSEETIGQFGEGYKIAALVLTRLGKSLTIYNYQNREKWTCRFVDSKRYEEKVLTFFIEKDWIFKEKPSHDLVFEIEDINPEEYETIVSKNLHLQEIDDEEKFESTWGTILFDRSGKIYVNGLYVSDANVKYGYDFKPQYLKLDRDRGMVKNFDIEWYASKMWTECEDHEKLQELLHNGGQEVTFITSTIYKEENLEELQLQTEEQFVSLHGENAIPVTSQEELNECSKKYVNAKPVMVMESLKTLLINYEPKVKKVVDTTEDWKRIEKYQEILGFKITIKQYNMIKKVVDEICKNN